MSIPQFLVLVLKLTPINTVSLNTVFLNPQNQCYPGNTCIGNQIFSKNLRNCLCFSGFFFGFFGIFFGIFLEFFCNVFGTFLDFFWQDILGGFFWDDSFGRIFWGGFLVYFILMQKELICLSKFWFLSRFWVKAE